MPTLTNVTAGSYSIYGNGGRKGVILSNGWIVVVGGYTTSPQDLYFYVSKDNGATWSTLCTILDKYGNRGSIDFIGTNIFVLFQSESDNDTYYAVFDATTVTGNIASSVQSLYSGMYSSYGDRMHTAVIDRQRGKIHVSWAGKSDTYSVISNIFYRGGSITTSGAITWDAVEILTKSNTDYGSAEGNQQPSITIDNNGVPIISFASSVLYFADSSNQQVTAGNSRSIIVAKRSNELFANSTYLHSSWTWKQIVGNGGVGVYEQKYPNIIFQKETGRLWCAWGGRDATYNYANNIMYSYSDDNGKTWIAPVRITDGDIGQDTPSLTCNVYGDVFIYWIGGVGSYQQVRYIKYDGTTKTFGSVTNYTTNSTSKSGVNTIYDMDGMKFNTPLFFYNVSSTIYFSGSWDIITMSATPRDIGMQSDKSNLLNYTITTDGTMGTITEKVNGTTIATKIATSGQSQKVVLNQTQWDNVPFGKYSVRNLAPLVSTWADEQTPSLGTTISDSSFKLYSTTNTAYATRRMQVYLKPSTTYTFTVDIETGADFVTTGVGAYYNLRELQNDGVTTIEHNVAPYVTTANTKTTLTRTFTTGSSFKSFSIVLGNHMSQGTSIFSNPMLVEGSTAVPYVPFGSANTLTVSMGRDSWTYTFDKRPSLNDDFSVLAKAVQDTNNVYLPSVKSQLASAIRGKGVTVSDTDSFEAMISAINGVVLGKKFAMGTATGLSNGTVTINNLTFRPSAVVFTFFNTTTKGVAVLIDPKYTAFNGYSVVGAKGQINSSNTPGGLGYLDLNGSPQNGSYMTANGFVFSAENGTITDISWTAYGQ